MAHNTSNTPADNDTPQHAQDALHVLDSYLYGCLDYGRAVADLTDPIRATFADISRDGITGQDTASIDADTHNILSLAAPTGYGPVTIDCHKLDRAVAVCDGPGASHLVSAVVRPVLSRHAWSKMAYTHAVDGYAFVMADKAGFDALVRAIKTALI